MGLSSPTLVSAMTDLTPAFTYIFAVASRMENLDLRVRSSQAKCVGTVVSIIGALVVTLYRGLPITILPQQSGNLLSHQPNWLLGGILLALSSVFISLLNIVQTWILKDYPTELMALFHAFIIVMNGWACRKKGPVYVAIFSPLGIVIALCMGIVMIGCVIIAIGFYGVIWGIAQERKKMVNHNNNEISTYVSSSTPLLYNKSIDTYIETERAAEAEAEKSTVTEPSVICNGETVVTTQGETVHEAPANDGKAERGDDDELGNSEKFRPWNLANRKARRKGGNYKRVDQGGNQGSGKNVLASQRANNGNQSRFNVLRDAEEILEVNMDEVRNLQSDKEAKNPAPNLEPTRQLHRRNWALFEHLIPSHVHDKITVVRPPADLLVKDKVAWKHSQDGSFSVRSAYQHITGLQDNEDAAFWRKLWQFVIASMQRIFGCGLLNPGIGLYFLTLICNLSMHMGCLELDWQTSFATACWSIWRWRNEEIFGNGFTCADPYFMVIQRTRASLEAFDSAIVKSGNHISRVNRVVRWEKPEFGWVKVNVDGACTRDDAERAACGGVIRDAHGRCLVGFTRRLGSCSSIHAELWGVLSGLETAIRYGFNRVLLEMDSLVAYELIRNTIIDTHPCASIIQSIQTRSRDFDEVIFKHVYREGNQAADMMAAWAHDAERSLCFLENIPAAIASILEEDLRGVGVLRACVS
ncbi:WAT1-related protein [Senna tora]|uniref:WAT1-related protein n=1 Tax=Senna tora TaxID=362788 RepID=A0A834SGW9_9FABA|nr:WAT1-related protein [Senna tora]